MKRAHKLSRFLLSLHLVFSFFPGVAYADVPSALAYVQNQQPSDWRTMALAAAGEPTDVSYMRGASHATAIERARQILALAAAGEDPRAFDGVDRVAELRADVRNNQIGSEQSLNDDFWGVMAFVAAGVAANDLAVSGSIATIRSAQNQDGGWSWTVEGASDVDDTAAAIMALRSAGAAIDDRDIVEAIDYLRSAQRPDGGFPNIPAPDSVSNAASDAWVMSSLQSLNINPATWQENGASPREHLLSLQQPDGGFSWVANPARSNAQITAYAVVSLSGSFYPVARAEEIAPASNGGDTPPPPGDPRVTFRIEGARDTVCAGATNARDAMEVVVDAARQCNFTYVIRQTDLGPYIEQINNEAAEGARGWMYRVNWHSPQVAASDYRLAVGDHVLWAFSQFGEEPLRIFADPETPARNQEVSVRIEEYNSEAKQWSVAQNARLIVNSVERPVPDGATTVAFASLGVHTAKARKPGRIASETKQFKIGSFNKGVDLHAVVEAPAENDGGQGGRDDGGQVRGDNDIREEIALTLSRANMDFGAVRAGGALQGMIEVRNDGAFPLYIESTVTGDALFTENTQVNGALWDTFSLDLARDAHQQVQLSVSVPAETPPGEKRGTFIVWAVRGQ